MRIGGDAFIITSNCLRVLFAYMKFYTDPALPSPAARAPAVKIRDKNAATMYFECSKMVNSRE